MQSFGGRPDYSGIWAAKSGSTAWGLVTIEWVGSGYHVSWEKHDGASPRLAGVDEVHQACAGLHPHLVPAYPVCIRYPRGI